MPPKGPDLDALVIRGRHQVLAVRMELDPANGCGVGAEVCGLGPGRVHPDPDSLVPGARGQQPASVGEGQAEDRIAVPGKSAKIEKNVAVVNSVKIASCIFIHF